MRDFARTAITIWGSFTMLVAVVATIVATAAPGSAAFSGCPTAQVTAGETTQITLRMDSPESSYVRVTSNPTGIALDFIDSEAHIGAGKWRIRVKLTAVVSSTSGVISFRERALEGDRILGDCAVKVEVLPAVTTTTTAPTTTTTTTTATTTTTTLPPSTTTTRPPPTTTTTTTLPPTTTTTTTTTTAAPATSSTTTTIVAPPVSEPPETPTTTVGGGGAPPSDATTTLPPTTQPTPSTAGDAPTTTVVAALPPQPATSTPLWLVMALITIILLGTATVVVSLIPGAASAVSARLGGLGGTTDARRPLRHRVANSWLGTLLWNRSRRIKGPTLRTRLRDSELGQSLQTRRDVRRARERISQRQG